MEIKRLPYSETTQEIGRLMQKMRQGITDSFNINNPNPSYETIMLHKLQSEKAMRGITDLYIKAISCECPGVMISFTDDELKHRAISPEEFYIQPIDQEQD